jgi:hypothetical protein
VQYANINSEDTHHYHHLFTTLWIKDTESTTHFFRHFTLGKTEAEAAGNSYSEQQLVSFSLARLNSTKKIKIYETALQLYKPEREHGKTFTLAELEKKFLPSLTRMALGHAAHTHNSRRPMHNLKRGNSRDTRKSRDNCTSKGQPQSAEAHATNSHNPLQRRLACYNCGEPRHTAPNCTKPRKVPPRNTNKANSASGTNSSDSNINGRDTKAVVCSAMAIKLEQGYPT